MPDFTNDIRWPHDAPFALCLTHDVDRIKKQLYHYLYYGLVGGWRTAIQQLRSIAKKITGVEPYWAFERIMEVLLFFLRVDPGATVELTWAGRFALVKFVITFFPTDVAEN